MSDNEQSKIRFKLGVLEVESEGSTAFLRTELPEVLKAILDLYKTSFSADQLNSQAR